VPGPLSPPRLLLSPEDRLLAAPANTPTCREAVARLWAGGRERSVLREAAAGLHRRMAKALEGQQVAGGVVSMMACV
jgi:hypothetical protein